MNTYEEYLQNRYNRLFIARSIFFAKKEELQKEIENKGMDLYIPNNLDWQLSFCITKAHEADIELLKVEQLIAEAGIPTGQLMGLKKIAEISNQPISPKFEKIYKE